MKKKVYWLYSTKDDVRDFPEDARRAAGFAIHLAENGQKAHYAVPMLGFGGSKVMEAVIDDDGNTYRAVFSVCFREAVYVLHVFMKKSKKGIATPKRDMALIKSRFKEAQRHYKEHFETEKMEGSLLSRPKAKKAVLPPVTATIHQGSGNVFADLGLNPTPEYMLKVAIARAINATIQKRKMTQSEAANIIGADQAKISALLRGKLDDFAIERLIKYVILLGHDLDVCISTPRGRKARGEAGHIRIKEYA